MRKYLNEQFIAACSNKERARIVQTKLINQNNPWYMSGLGGSDTEDFIFLLSINETVQYFGDSGDLAKRNGWYWVGAEKDKEDRGEYGIREMIHKDGRGQFLYDQYNDARIAKNLHNEESWWRLRSPGRDNMYTAAVSPVGAIIVTGTPHTKNGMRPALWVRK